MACRGPLQVATETHFTYQRKGRWRSSTHDIRKGASTPPLHSFSYDGTDVKSNTSSGTLHSKNLNKPNTSQICLLLHCQARRVAAEGKFADWRNSQKYKATPQSRLQLYQVQTHHFVIKKRTTFFFFFLFLKLFTLLGVPFYSRKRLSSTVQHCTQLMEMTKGSAVVCPPERLPTLNHSSRITAATK